MRNIIEKNIHIFSGLGFATIFGFSFFFTAEALDHIDLYHFLSFRFILAVLVMTILNALKIVRIPLNKDFLNRDVLLMVLLQPVIYFTAESTGIILTSSSEAGLMIALIPIFVAIFSGIILKEHPTVKQYPFILLSVAGVIIIAVMQGKVNLSTNYLGTGLLLIAVLAAAGYNLVTRKLTGRYSPMALTYYMMVGGALAFTLMAVLRLLAQGEISRYFLPLTEANVYFPLLYLGIFSSVLAFFLINFTLAKVTAAQTTVFANLSTIIAVLAGVLLRSEPFFFYHFWGGLFIILGVAGTNYFAEEKCLARKTKAHVRF
jgi:drug/metabolite transporter (DMT)-like permease